MSEQEHAAEAEHREKEAYERGETVQSFDSTMELEDAMREAQRRARARMDERRKKSAREADREARATQYSYAERAEAAMARPFCASRPRRCTAATTPNALSPTCWRRSKAATRPRWPAIL